MLTGRPRTITLHGCWDAAASRLMFQGCLHYQKKLTARVFKGKVWTILVCNFRIWAEQKDSTISKLSFHTCCVWLVGYIKVILVMVNFFFFLHFFPTLNLNTILNLLCCCSLGELFWKKGLPFLQVVFLGLDWSECELSAQWLAPVYFSERLCLHAWSLGAGSLLRAGSWGAFFA